jgi:hypothetical protein
LIKEYLRELSREDPMIQIRRFELLVAALSICATVLSPSLAAQSIVADHSSVTQFDQIPQAYIEQIQLNRSFYYAHTSHGSQIVTGIDMLSIENSAYATPYIYEVGDDLGGYGDTTWAPPLRAYLNDHDEINVAMLSWCGGVSDNSVEGINAYLNKMANLEEDYPSVTFIYMTGHLDGSGDEGNLTLRNNQIRDYCVANGKVLFDFADIETWDPDGVRYADGSDACEWCYDWCGSHTCPDCSGCAHSHCFNCYQKGKAFWWMMARVEGWSTNPQPCGGCVGRVGDANGNGDDEPTIGDISIMIDAKFIAGDCEQAHLCLAEADVNLSGGASPVCDDISVSDISILIDYLFITGSAGMALPDCPS